MSAFGAAAGFIAAIGSTACSPTRMALGAQQTKVLVLMLWRGVAIIAISATVGVLGVLGALGLTRYPSSIWSASRHSTGQRMRSSAAFAAVTLLASYLPVRRA